MFNHLIQQSWHLSCNKHFWALIVSKLAWNDGNPDRTPIYIQHDTTKNHTCICIITLCLLPNFKHYVRCKFPHPTTSPFSLDKCLHHPSHHWPQHLWCVANVAAPPLGHGVRQVRWPQRLEVFWQRFCEHITPRHEVWYQIDSNCCSKYASYVKQAPSVDANGDGERWTCWCRWCCWWLWWCQLLLFTNYTLFFLSTSRC